MDTHMLPHSYLKLNIDMEKLYSNMSACFFKQRKWQRTIDFADEVWVGTYSK